MSVETWHLISLGVVVVCLAIIGGVGIHCCRLDRIRRAARLSDPWSRRQRSKDGLL